MTAPQFTDETAARKHLEALRWPNGVSCKYIVALGMLRAIVADGFLRFRPYG
jgi:hypothetical protein